MSRPTLPRTAPSFRRHLALALALTALAVHDPQGATSEAPPVATTSASAPAPSPVTLAPRERPVAAPVGDPLSVSIEVIGVDVPLGAVGLQADGAMQTPDFGDAAWYSPGPRPGEPGGSVLVAHVHGPAGPDVFWRLGELRPGDVVTVRHTEGVSRFLVDEVSQTPKDALPTDRIWADTQQPLLRLITCGGQRDPERGGYPDNTVVFAHLI